MKYIILFFGLLPCMTMAQRTKKIMLPTDSLLKVTEQLFEIYTTNRFVDSTLMAVALRRIQNGRGVSAPTLAHLLAESGSEAMKNNSKPMCDTLFNWKETPKALLTPVLIAKLRDFPPLKSDTLFRNHFLERVYEARRYVSTQYLALQELNYLTGMYLYAQGLSEKSDNFLLDTFRPLYYELGITHDYSVEITSPMYDLQKSVFWELAEHWSRRMDNKKMSILRNYPQFDTFKNSNQDKQRFNTYLLKVGLEPLKY
jgi:hypothetical protein